ncbi:hypothetical protein ASC95_28005 [Pelomonas sp. Root1217]|uniref:FadR/GntR family transcriptional regulator n=1 Tax=Pelomonas sp. Root1217 TaxID=1736430 RepID=UPI000709436C|nr:FCD domain-containing protein [Pelomonas sp. Root1217]KQV59564.1 hypothetical protein ASC95_28005 [Pelomonas sp. Root1217]
MLTSPQGGDPPRQYRLVAEQIRRLIRMDSIRSGARLPPERQLASQFGVSRQVVREAMIALEIDGQVVIRGGSGVYACGAHRGNALPSMLGQTSAELMQARVVLERTIVSLAANRASKSGLQHVEKALDAMREDLACGLNPVKADRQFHLGIVEMAGCNALSGVVGMLFDGSSPISTDTGSRPDAARCWQLALAEHESIFQALEARDPITADAALCSHLLASRSRCRGGL